uniref:Chemosensory protein n=1 Tax=Blattella germanica TaxID=6973 RepID=A0A0X8DCB2_BLAGE|nr:chemosensory protein [Blattella germanica]WPE03555.1 sensory neuron membrane protein 1d [Blattella germanica]
MQLAVEKLPAKWLGIGGLILFALGSGIGFYGFPALIRSQIASNLALKKDSDIRKLWSKIPDGIDFKIYIFNYTNPNEIQTGGKPVVQEIGPFFYYEYKEKVDLKDIEKEDAVLFNPKDSWVFIKEKSGALTGDEMVTIPHATILGMALAVEREKPAALRLVNKAIPFLFGNLSTIFLTAPVRKILFEGVPIYCNVTDFSAKAICSEIRKKEKDFHNLGDDIFGFSFFGMKNASVGGRFKVKRGINDIKEVGQVLEFNGEKVQTVWSGEECNKFRGTDSTIFAPFLTPSDKIEAFAPDLCRSIAAEFKEETVFKGIRGYVYSAGFGDMSTDPALKCFCTSPETCWKKGLHDLTRCQGAPIIASLPHFYDADPEYANAITGLNPNKEQHEITMVFEPLTSTPLVAYKRLQFNIAIHKIDKIDLMKDIPTVLLPIMWVQEGMELKQEYLDKVGSIFKILGAVGILKWVMMVLGGGMGAAGAGIAYKKKSTEMNLEGTPPNVPKKPTGIAPLEVQTPPRY